MTPDVHALTGPYVLNALPEDERIGFEAHLADCQSCSAEVAELLEAANKLGTAVATEPPPTLKARVLATAATTRQLPPLVRPDETVQSTTAARHRRSFNRRSFFSLAAASAAVVGTGAVAIDQYRESNRVQQQNDQLAAVLSENDAKTVRGTVSGGGQATVVMSARQDSAVVLLHGLRELPDGRTYQMWLMDKTQQAHSVGLANGASADQTKLIQGGVADKVMFGLTVERQGGATEPNLPPVALIAMA